MSDNEEEAIEVSSEDKEDVGRNREYRKEEVIYKLGKVLKVADFLKKYSYPISLKSYSLNYRS